MRRRNWMAALAIAGLALGYAPGAAQATPDRSQAIRERSDGWERPPRFRVGPVARVEGGKRGVGGRIDRVAAPRGSDPSIPEPAAALLFGIGLLAIRSRSGAARVG